jgi:hypothetical protein
MTKRTSGGQRTAAVRQARWRERIDHAGLRRVTVVVPAERVEELRAIAARMVEESGEQSPLSE